MKLGNIVSRVIIDKRKLTEYALNPDNPVGADKAAMFQRHLGFTINNYETLLEQISALALEAEAILGKSDQHGQRASSRFRDYRSRTRAARNCAYRLDSRV